MHLEACNTLSIVLSAPCFKHLSAKFTGDRMRKRALLYVMLQSELALSVRVVALPVGFNDIVRDGTKEERGKTVSVWAWGP